MMTRNGFCYTRQVNLAVSFALALVQTAKSRRYLSAALSFAHLEMESVVRPPKPLSVSKNHPKDVHNKRHNTPSGGCVYFSSSTAALLDNH